MRFFWFLMVLLAGGLLLLIVTHDSGTILGLDNTLFAGTLYFGLWAAVLIVGMSRSGIGFGAASRHIAFWLALMVLLVGGYQFRHELSDAVNIFSGG